MIRTRPVSIDQARAAVEAVPRTDATIADTLGRALRRGVLNKSMTLSIGAELKNQEVAKNTDTAIRAVADSVRCSPRHRAMLDNVLNAKSKNRNVFFKMIDILSVATSTAVLGAGMVVSNLLGKLGVDIAVASNAPIGDSLVQGYAWAATGIMVSAIGAAAVFESSQAEKNKWGV